LQALDIYSTYDRFPYVKSYTYVYTVSQVSVLPGDSNKYQL